MHAPRGFIGGIARVLFGLCLGLLLTGTARAATATYTVLLDTDNDLSSDTRNCPPDDTEN